MGEIDAAGEVPSFPKSAVLLALAAILTVAAAGIGLSWLVDGRLRIIATSQLEVITSAQQVEHLNAEKDTTIRLAARSGDLADLERVAALQQDLQGALVVLEQAISLPENREAFREVERADRQLQQAEARQFRLIAAGRPEEARRLARQRSYQDLRQTFNDRLDEIEARSHRYVESSRAGVDRMLFWNVVANGVAILLVAGALVLLFQRTRDWAGRLTRMHREARTAARAKADFLAAMSHEIRTPLNGVIGFADILLDDPDLKPGQRRQVALIQSAGGMLLTVVNDILDLSKIEAGKLELDCDPFALEALADEAISIIRTTANAKGIRVSLLVDRELSSHYLGDGDRLRQILLNLLNNAIKFTERGRVMVVLRKGREATGADDVDDVVVSVTDSGIGIEPELAAKLFEPFTQADGSIAKKYGGTGLGLSICRRLLALMGGTIALTSKPGRGSTFTVSVPLKRCAAGQAGASEVNASVVEPASILVVEDLAMNREIAAGLLGKTGHRVEFAASGEEAIEMVAKHDYDLLLMDIQMPGIDGMETTKRIRDLPTNRAHVPILAMTANTLPEQVRSYLSAGMQGHVAKPLKAVALDAAIARVLAQTPTAAAHPPESAAEPVFDRAVYDSVVAIMGADRLEKHIETFSHLVAETATMDPDDADLEANAHKIGSQAGALGLMRLSAAARMLEDACRAKGDTVGAAAVFVAAAGDVEELPRIGDAKRERSAQLA